MKISNEEVNENFILNKENWLKDNNDRLNIDFTKTYDDYDPEIDMYKSPSDFFYSLNGYKMFMYSDKLSDILKESFTFYKSNNSYYYFDDDGRENQTSTDLFSVLYKEDKILNLSKVEENLSFQQMESDSSGIKTIHLLGDEVNELAKGSEEIKYYSLPEEVKVYFLKEFSTEIRLNKALDFHINNNYQGKIKNISFDGINGSLNKALIKNFSFKLNEKELKSVHEKVRKQFKNKGLKV